MVVGLQAACPSHLTLWRLSSWEMGICPVPSSSSAVVPDHHAAHTGLWKASSSCKNAAWSSSPRTWLEVNTDFLRDLNTWLAVLIRLWVLSEQEQ